MLEKKLGAHISLATIAGFEHLTAILTDIIQRTKRDEKCYTRYERFVGMARC